MRITACQCCGESIDAGLRGPLPKRCVSCGGSRRMRVPPHLRKKRSTKRPEDRIRSDRFTFVEGRIQSACGTCGRRLWLCQKQAAKYERHFCGASCRAIASRTAVPHRFKCVRCGKQCSMQGKPRKKMKGIYCSRQCAGATQREKAAVARTHRDLWDWFHSWDSQRPPVRLYQVRLLGRCARCSAVLNGRRKVCRKCRRSAEAEARREYNKTGKTHRKRCRKFGVPWDSKVRRKAVFARDGYRCCICLRPTLRRGLSVDGRIHPRTPTVDHIVPLSRGVKGHTWDNVQCACHECNTKKSNTMKAEQMRLF